MATVEIPDELAEVLVRFGVISEIRPPGSASSSSYFLAYFLKKGNPGDQTGSPFLQANFAVVNGEKNDDGKERQQVASGARVESPTARDEPSGIGQESLSARDEPEGARVEPKAAWDESSGAGQEPQATRDQPQGETGEGWAYRACPGLAGAGCAGGVAEVALEGPISTGGPVGGQDEQVDVVLAFEGWNQMAARAGLAKAMRLTADRERKLNLRLRECGGLAGWRAALGKIESNPWLCGENDRGWRADFDFVLQPKSFNKIVEGAYERKQGSSGTQAGRAAGGKQLGEGDRRRALADAALRVVERGAGEPAAGWPDFADSDEDAE